MEVKMLEIRDRNTFMPVLAIRPVPANEEQRYLLRRDGYAGNASERCVILVKNQCGGVSYDPYHWPESPRTMRVAHLYIEQNWHVLSDGSVVDVEHILGETTRRKLSERLTASEVT
jgi:hypothetical protein